MSTTQKITTKERIHRSGSERALIGICLNKPDQLILASGSGLKPEHFAVDAHKYIYMAMSYLVEQGNEPDPVSITNVFTDEKANKAIEEIGGISYLEAAKLTPYLGNTQMFIDQIKQAAARRDIYDKAEAVKRRMEKDADSDVNSVISAVESDFRDISIEYQVAQGVTKLGDAAADRLKQRLLNPKDVLGLKTGWKAFDLAARGLVNGELTVIGARGKVGKSTTLMNWCEKISVQDGIPVLYVNTELRDEEQEDRLLSLISGVAHEEIENGQFGKDTYNGLAKDKIKAIQDANKKLKESQFHHIYMPDFTAEKIMALARKYQVEHGIQLLVFDYIKLPSSNANFGDKEFQALGYFTSMLKDLAGTLNIPVISAVQLNRGAVKKEDLDDSDIAGSDRILQLANRVCFLRWSTEEERAITGASHQFKIHVQRAGKPLDWTPVDCTTDTWRQTMREVN
ncbi:replicative DNA helicase [Bacillus paranthracis]|uniref:replicative DNA helicase n=1 Tax=Bacillus paranthracis TaxID=2026186 RepID=UPI001F0896F1|nr:DnaB-like helicase C-terminal domain-containing protein [Bacillus paranthracis]